MDTLNIACDRCKGTGRVPLPVSAFSGGATTQACLRCGGVGTTPTPVIHPAPAEFTAEECKLDDVLHFFHYAHLPEGILRDTSAQFARLARIIVDVCPRCPQRTIALNNLLAAKDAAVRTHVRKA